MWCMIPPAQEIDSGVHSDLESFLDAHVREQEPWDGPAALIFTDGFTRGRQARPQWPAASAVHVDFGWAARRRARKWGLPTGTTREVIERHRLGPGEMLVVDPATGRFLRPGEVPELGQWQQFVSGAALLPINPSEEFSTASTPEAAEGLGIVGLE